MKKKTVSIIALGVLVLVSLASCLFRQCPVTPVVGDDPAVMLIDERDDDGTVEGSYSSKFDNMDYVNRWLAHNNKKFWLIQFMPVVPGETLVVFHEPKGTAYVYFNKDGTRVRIHKYPGSFEYVRDMTDEDREFAEHLRTPNGKQYIRKPGYTR